MTEQKGLKVPKEFNVSEFTKPPRLTRCIVGRKLDALAPEQIAKVETALRVKEVETAGIQYRLEQWGVQGINHNALRLHRIGACACKVNYAGG